MISKHMYSTLRSYYFIVNCSIELTKENPSLSHNQIATQQSFLWIVTIANNFLHMELRSN